MDPTHIHLPGQIVGVVGPNGCGKSNVIDALRWVLGESKASALRGESMQDVIFNGSLKRKPVARASVELVFDNSLGKAAGQWSGYAEISIKRVLLRNGDSSYHINNQKVRRRDITDIFLGTGLGARAYAIVEQGMISRIIEAKPEELRVFLEEAAGVSRYRDRRRETGQRLADTRDNLLRVDDILQEMDKQLLHLGVQAEVAGRYRELESRRDTSQQLLWLLKKQDAALQRADFATQVEKLRTELDLQTALLRETESRLETQRSTQYLYTDAVHAKQGELYSVNAEIARLELEIKHAQQQQQRLTQQIDSMQRKVAQQMQQRQIAQSQLEHWQQQQEEAVIRQLDARGQVEGVDLAQAEDAARIAQDDYNQRLREQLQLQQQLQLAQTQLEHVLRHTGQLESRRARLLHEQQILSPIDLDALQLAHAESVELDLFCAEQDETLALLLAQLPVAEQHREQARSALQHQERQASLTFAHLQALQQLQAGCDKSLAGWLALHSLDGLPNLWQSIRIRHGWENALEAVLRERLNARAIPDLAASGCMHDAPPAGAALYETGHDYPLLSGTPPAGLLPLLSYVECQDLAVLRAISSWLASAYAVADIDQAVSMRGQLPQGSYFVTQQGHLVDQFSVLFYAPDNQLHGVLARQREIGQLEAELIVHHVSVDDLKTSLDGYEQNYRLIEIEISSARSALSESKQRQHALQIQMLKLNQAHEQSRERSERITVELQEVIDLLGGEQNQQRGMADKITQLRERLAQFQSQVDAAQQDANASQTGLREQREHAHLLQHAMQEANYYLRTCQDKVANFHDNIQMLAGELIQSEHALDQLRAEVSGSADETAVDSLQHRLQTRHIAEQDLTAARTLLETGTIDLQNLEQARLSCEHRLNGLRAQLGELSLKEQEARLHYEQWAENMHGVDESPLLPLLAAAKPGQLHSELNRLNREIEALGAVNLAALDELQSATERKLYLEAQAVDLQEAMATLEDAIRHIDRESRDLLMETFNQVNLHLAELFPVLFAGGEARLVLTGEEILDGGVQVMAQPPGKKNSSIHLLSGGEKALTAIALIFSLFQLNPAPFCLLDEVDAPLDDTNTERLCALVRKMALQTQFVFISHNKIAMEMAQQLIGVTMQEKGVSKVVSVDIEAALRMRDGVV